MFRVLATSRTPYYTEAAAIGAEFFEDANDFCEEHPDVVILATSILSTEPVLRKLPLTRLKRSTLIVDVLSVKVGVALLGECLQSARAREVASAADAAAGAPKSCLTPSVDQQTLQHMDCFSKYHTFLSCWLC